MKILLLLLLIICASCATVFKEINSESGTGIIYRDANTGVIKAFVFDGEKGTKIVCYDPIELRKKWKKYNH